MEHEPPIRRVTRQHPCPICQKPDWCGVVGDHSDPDLAICMRIPSERSTMNGGYLHVLKRTPSGAYPPSTQPPANAESRRCVDDHAQSLRTAEDAIAALSRRRGRPTVVYRYYDASGDAIALVARWDIGGTKTIRMACRVGPHEWQASALPGPRPLYRLPELIQRADETVYVVEGEKCAERLFAEGRMATTWMGGSKAVSKTDFTPLAGRDVVLLPDHEEPGRSAMHDVAERLTALSDRPHIRLLALDCLPTGEPMSAGGDVVDWFEAGGDATQLDRLAEQAEVIGGRRDERTHYEAFPIDALPTVLAAMVEQVSTVVQVDAAMAAVPGLVVAAAAIGSTHRVRIDDAWTEPSILWGVVVAESGEGKTPAAEKMLTPLRRLDADAAIRNEQRLADHEVKRQQHARALERWRRAQKGNEPTDDPPPAPPRPRLEQYVVSDVTPERLIECLSDNPRGLLLERDELSGFFTGFGRYAKGASGCERGLYLSVHSAQPVVVDRKTSERRTLRVPDPHVSITGGIQHALAATALSEQDWSAGLAARFLWARPPSQRRRYRPAEVDRAVDSAYRRAIESLARRRVPDGEPATEVGLTVAARRLLGLHLDRLSAWRESTDGSIRGVLAKLHGITARIALVLHCVDAATSGTPTETPIAASTMGNAIRLANWFAREAERFIALQHESSEQAASRRLAEWIATRGGEVSVRDVQMGRRTYRSSVEAEEALRRLVAEGYGGWIDVPAGPRGGRPTRRFRLG